MIQELIIVDKVESICKEALRLNKFLLMREYDGELVGYNPALVNLTNIKRHRGKQSKFISWRLTNFNGYISHKVPFIKSKA